MKASPLSRRPTFGLMAATMLTLALAMPAHAKQQSTQFQVSLTITGPSLAVDNHLRWPDARVLYRDDRSLFQAVPGRLEQVRKRVKGELVGWRWDERGTNDTGWQAMGHSPKGECMQLLAQSVRGVDMVRLHTRRCDQGGL